MPKKKESPSWVPQPGEKVLVLLDPLTAAMFHWPSRMRLGTVNEVSGDRVGVHFTNGDKAALQIEDVRQLKIHGASNDPPATPDRRARGARRAPRGKARGQDTRASARS